MSTPLKILHTADWHLGKRLYGHNRYQEFTEFLDWLFECITQQRIEVLIVAGDIFDTMTPSNKSQSLYYQFLSSVTNTCCQHIVIVGGNHDSPSLLDAPKHILKAINVHVVGSACDNIADEVITLTDSNNQPKAIIIAIPYLRDKDLRHSVSGESSSDKQDKLLNGIHHHYAQATDIAKQRQQQFFNDYGKIPIIATGHLMAVGGTTTVDDGVRDLYVGNLGGISADVFDPIIDYVALGHLHVPQSVGGHEHIRYSGSPIAMGFGEAKQQKQVLTVVFEQNKPIDIERVAIPCFHMLAQIKGDFETIERQLYELQWLNQPIWIEVIYQSDTIIANLADTLTELTKNTQLNIIKVKNQQMHQQALQQSVTSETLQELQSQDVFQRRLDQGNVDKHQQKQLMQCFQQIIHEINNDDLQAK